MASKRYALISVSDKSNLKELAAALSKVDVQIISTGGTATHLRDSGFEVTDIAEITGFPEIMDGRVKTLHPKVHGGLLARRDLESHMKTLSEHGISPIDYVVVNLYPFEETVKKEGVTLEEAIEQIDIGGPSMLRSAAKNYKSVTVITDPEDYRNVSEELEKNGETSLETRAALAAKVFEKTASYDAVIANFLCLKGEHRESESTDPIWPQTLLQPMKLQEEMRYGENPHQAAAFYTIPGITETSLSTCRQLHGKQLSYNNILDAEGALEMVRDFADLAPSAAVIVKHSNPCGIAIADTLSSAYEKARSTDPDSAFGGIVALSSEVDESTAELINATFNEIVIAPSYSKAALATLQKKKNLRVLETGPFTPKSDQKIIRGIVGGALVTDRDLGLVSTKDLKTVTETQPEESDLKSLLFAWRCVKWVKSNAIVYTGADQTIGIGAGQMSRIDSANIGVTKARQPLKGGYMASDAFFPFRDCVDIASKQGIKAIIQPGGSMRDQESIDAANEHGIIMVFTGMRHFRH